MRKGETRAAYDQRMRDDMRNRAASRMKADAKFLERKIAGVQREIDRRSAQTVREK